MKKRNNSLMEELRQTRPFRSREQEALLSVLRTADELRRGLGRVAEGEGLSIQLYNVLRILRGAGPEGLPTLEIAQRMVERSPGITRLVDRLESQQLVKRSRTSGDRRCVYCAISERGLEVLARLDGPVDAWTGDHLGWLGAETLEKFIELLEQVRGRLHTGTTPVDSENPD